MINHPKAAPDLVPGQFKVNQAWIVFQMNEEPIGTEREGDFNCIALMDAASCFIFHMIMVPVGEAEPPVQEVRTLLKEGWKTKRQYPDMLLVPAGRFQRLLPAEAMRLGIDVVPVFERRLAAFVEEAQQDFIEHLRGGEPDA